MLIDGGVANNYPIDEIRKMGADIIIGVDVQDDLKNRDQLRDATRIMVQITNLGMIERMKENAKNTDIYIKPDIRDFGVISFDEGQEIIRKGEDAAFGVYEKLKELAAMQGNYHRPDLKVCPDSLHINKISINKLDNFTRAYVLGKLRFRQHKEIGYDQLKIGTDNLAATDNFSAISYSLDPDPPGDELRLSLTPNNIRNYLKLGVHYDDLYKTGVLVNFTRKRLFLRNDVASLDVILGDNIRYNFDYYIDNGFYFSFGFKSKLTQFSRNVATDFSNGELLRQLGLNTINIDFTDWTNQAYLQTVFVQKYLIAAGLEHKHLKIKSETLQDDQPAFENSDYLSLFGYLKYDSFDNRYFPKSGWYVSGDFQSYLSSTNLTGNFRRFSIAKGEIGTAHTFFRRLTAKLQAEGGFAFGPESVPFFDFILGGYGFAPVNNIRSFYGYDFLSFSGDSYIKGTGTLDWEFYKKNHVNFATNVAQIGDNLFDSPDWITDKPKLGYAVGYGLESVIGPLEIKYSWSPEVGHGYTWFSIGFWF
jgi:NTE family protein